MAFSDQQIIIEPAVGISTVEPTIKFTGLGNSITTLRALPTNYAGVAFETQSGKLLTITADNSSGVIFAASDVNQIPGIELRNTGTVVLAGYGTTYFVGIGTTNPTSKLHVVGNALITGITTMGLGSTSSPAVNSTMSFELTNDTTLTVRVRGTDGAIRTGIVTLS